LRPYTLLRPRAEMAAVNVAIWPAGSDETEGQDHTL
jgi:hypothetical protein